MSGGKQNPNAWNNWYHVVGSTYGTWLPGDPRGFRTFRHHEHVEGDYKNPPPQGSYDTRHAESKRKLKWPPVSLGERQRQVVLGAMVEKLRADGIELIALAVGRHHFHWRWGVITFTCWLGFPRWMRRRVIDMSARCCVTAVTLHPVSLRAERGGTPRSGCVNSSSSPRVRSGHHGPSAPPSEIVSTKSMSPSTSGGM